MKMGTDTERQLFIMRLLALIAVVVLLALAGCAGVPPAGCHPGQHRCQTDAECEDEEAYFLDVEEGDQR